jgi:DNA-binding transcriptional ArsR family regulator
MTALMQADVETELRSDKEFSAELDELMRNARRASDFLKALSHENRLLLLCLLSEGERSVSELENILSMRQSAVSQQLARLRLDGLVAARRDGKAVYYSIADDNARRMVAVIYDIFCGCAPRPNGGGSGAPRG